MEREVGGGIGMGNTCKLKAVSFQCMTKSTTNKIKKNQKENLPIMGLVCYNVKHTWEMWDSIIS